MKRLLILIITVFSLTAFTSDENGPQTTDGAFTTLMIAAADIGKYTETLRDNPSAFQATGTTGAGVCVTNSGNAYEGQMMVWSAFPDVASALVGGTKYDPQQAPRQFKNLRDIKYGVTWKPLTPFRLEPGYERVQRIKVSAENLQAFNEGLNKLEASIQAAGYPNFFNGAFVQIGGGTHEIETLMVRSITRDAQSMGVLFDDYFAGTATWAADYDSLMLLGEVMSDNMEICEQVYFGS
tara:strand:+ start:603 stop:1316 length:714 start_codon:yes stop_codon:yes gene_type:complete